MQLLTARQSDKPRKFYLLTTEDTGHTQLQVFGFDLRALMAALQALVGKPVTAYVFLGERWPIAKGPPRALVTPYNIKLPIIPPEAQAVADEEDGFFGERPVQLPVLTAAELAALEAEEEEDQEVTDDQDQTQEEPPP